MLFVKFSFLYNFGVYYVKDYIVLQLANRYECQVEVHVKLHVNVQKYYEHVMCVITSLVTIIIEYWVMIG